MEREAVREELIGLSNADLEAVKANHGNSSEYYIVANQLLRERIDNQQEIIVKWTKAIG